MIWVGTELKDHRVPTPCHQQRHLLLNQVTQSTITVTNSPRPVRWGEELQTNLVWDTEVLIVSSLVTGDTPGAVGHRRGQLQWDSCSGPAERDRGWSQNVGALTTVSCSSESCRDLTVL